MQSPEVAERVLVRRPQIGDTRPAPPEPPEPPRQDGQAGRPAAAAPQAAPAAATAAAAAAGGSGPVAGVGPSSRRPRVIAPVELDEETLERRRGRERKGRPDRPLPDGAST